MASTSEATVWYPADIFATRPNVHRDFGLVVLNQPLENQVVFYAQVWMNAVFRVGADGGANCVFDLNKANGTPDHLTLDAVVGDLDSLRSDARKYWQSEGSEIIHDPYQYSTDMTKAVDYVKTFVVPTRAEYTPSNNEMRELSLQQIKTGPKIQDVVCIGGLGGRVDQAMSILHHLYIFQRASEYDAGRIFLLSNEAITFVLKSGKHKIKVRESFREVGLNKNIGIIPLKEPSMITTTGLEWDVTDWPTEFGGQISTSNYVREDWVTVETTKDVLFTIDMKFS